MKQTEGLYRFSRLVVLLTAGVATLVVVLGIVGYVFFMRSVDLPEARAIAERELRSGTLRFGEQVERAAHVYIRRPSDYYRGANGVLAATNERLIFIGVAPRGNFDSPDAPPVILQQEFTSDTVLRLRPSRIFFGTTRGVIAERGGQEGRYGATSRHWHELEELSSYVNRLHESQRAQAARERRLREAVARIVAEPLYYTVKRGDAISTIANWFGTTVEDLQRWNNLEGTRIRIGEQLLVKPGASTAGSPPTDSAPQSG
jgi:hypothetical protein